MAVVKFPTDHYWAKAEIFIRKQSRYLHPAMVDWVLNDMRDRHAALKIPDSMSIPDVPTACSEAVQAAAETVNRAWASAHDRAIVQMVQLEIELYQAKFESGPQPPKPMKRDTLKIVKFGQD